MKTLQVNPKSSMLGVTLLELLIVMAMIAIVASIAAPSFDSSISRNNVQSMRDSLFHAMQYARSEAVKRKVSVGLCASADQVTCAGNADWHSGWIVYADQNGNGSQDGVADEVAIQAQYGEGNLQTPVAVDADMILFNRLGLANNANIAIYFVDPKHPDTTNRRGVEVSATGTVMLRKG